MTNLDTHRLLSVTRGNTNLQVSQGLLLVPGDKGDEVIGVKRLFTTPLYWSLPRVFLGDKVTSYNGEYFLKNSEVYCTVNQKILAINDFSLIMTFLYEDCPWYNIVSRCFMITYLIPAIQDI